MVRGPGCRRSLAFWTCRDRASSTEWEVPTFSSAWASVASALYRPSPRAYTGTPPVLEYPGHFLVKRVTNATTIRFKTRLLYLSAALKAHRVGLEEVDDRIWSLYFCHVLLGRIDERKALMKGQLGVTHVPG